MTSDEELKSWVAAHPYLESVARFHSALDQTVAHSDLVPIRAPNFELIADEFAEGTPLLHSLRLPIAFAKPGIALVRELAETAASENISETVSQSAREIGSFISDHGDEAPDVLGRVVTSVCPDGITSSPELLRLLSWIALRAVLKDVTRGFDDWRAGKTWGREYCPTCGARPVLALLMSAESVRERVFSCGRCQTQWIYKRIGCPYCLNLNPSGTTILEIEGESGFRLDVCNECKGYTKTYAGSGLEAVFRADWTTLHLDVLATQEGYKRLGTSLYDV